MGQIRQRRTVRPGSSINRIRWFLAHGPHGWLTNQDIAARLQLSSDLVSKSLWALGEKGYVRKHKTGKHCLWIWHKERVEAVPGPIDIPLFKDFENMQPHSAIQLSKADHLQSLGKDTSYRYEGADASLLERFPNPMKLTVSHPGAHAETRIKIVSPEFTSLCPLTGQPDFATIVVEYQPREWCVESKAWKLFLGSFRQTGEFHEACVTRIAQALVDLLQPAYLKVEGQFTPRGGIPFWPTFEYWHEGE